MFRHPFTQIISGATGSGKTQWLKRFLRHRKKMIEPSVELVIYCYGELNSTVFGLQEEKQIELHSGVPSEEFVKEKAKQQKLLLILDDLMINITSKFLDTIFTKGSHNWGVSVVFVTQHLFTKQIKTARNNAHYFVLMRNPAGALQIRNLATQLFPHKAAYFLEAYMDATREPFSYLVVDMHPTTPDHLRLKTYIYPDELTVVYAPKDANQ